MRYLAALCFLLISCSEEAKPSPKASPDGKAEVQPEEKKYEKLAKLYPPPKKLTRPEPIQPDVAAADVIEWQAKTNADAASYVEACDGYKALLAKQTEEKRISLRVHQPIDLKTPYWIFAIEEKEGERTSLLNYCTLLATTLEIRCSPVGVAVCP